MVDWKLILQIAGVCLGLLYLWYEYRADVRVWIVGLIMPFIHGVLYYTAGLYADMTMEFYYVAAGVYGLVMWTRPKSSAQVNISHTPRRHIAPLVLVCAAAFVVISFVLARHTDSTVPYWDAATTAMSIVGMWMLSRKYVEVWLVWIAVDVISCVLYVYKGIPYTGLLFGIYSVLAVAGYVRWLRQARTLKQTQKTIES
ncbi:MAG: nicotinamide riboside transporter PnuC [Alistipes sp.]|jgi:nicotinamide mononucleotide transporter|nr:nicotinamide riboside transporter PnuC [Alistipes sp.]